MMPRWITLAGVLAPAILSMSPASAEPYFWGLQAEQLEYRTDGDDNMLIDPADLPVKPADSVDQVVWKYGVDGE